MAQTESTESEEAEPKPPRPEAQASRAGIRTGRNLPAAIGVGALLGGLVLLTLLTVKATFLLYMGAAVAVALDELSKAARTKDIAIPVIPAALGGAAMLTCTYWLGYKGGEAALGLTIVAVVGYRLTQGTQGYVTDVTAGVFAVIYLPFLASFIAALLAPADGARRVLTFVIVVICSDIGGYFAGITLGRGTRHPMAPKISPKKTWEGFAGSAGACLIAGWLTVTLLLHGHAWQGLLLGAASVVTAIAGDLVESSIKRDLEIKDMGTLLPGHGGVLDRIDSLLVTAPVAWLLLTAFIQRLFGAAKGSSNPQYSRRSGEQTMRFKTHHLVLLAYVGAGIYFAWNRGYLNVPILKTIGSAFLAILFWWLILLGVNLHIH